ncbi:MAG: hypothetical protein DRI61_13825 [Chloroflexi bacterium]|nr:MAG: hypothetical protein DRI61_13825 [Chloroflexota bacterium]
MERTVMLIIPQWQARAFISAQLQEEGFRVKSFPDFETAVAFLCRTPVLPDVVVLDTHRLRLPLDKLNDFRRLLGETPLLLCTGPYRVKELDLEALRPNRILMRPFTVEEVVKAVKGMM